MYQILLIKDSKKCIFIGYTALWIGIWKCFTQGVSVCPTNEARLSQQKWKAKFSSVGLLAFHSAKALLNAVFIMKKFHGARGTRTPYADIYINHSRVCAKQVHIL